MKHSPHVALVLVSVMLSACGSGSDSASTKTPAAQATPPQTPTAASNTGADDSAKPLAARAAKGACAVVSRAEVSAAFGAPAPAGQTTPLGCVYRLGLKQLSVTTNDATKDNRQALRLALRHPAPGRKVVLGSGVDALVTPTVKPGRGHGSQVRVAFIRGRTSAAILLTDARPEARSVSAAAVRLGRAAVERL